MSNYEARLTRLTAKFNKPNKVAKTQPGRTARAGGVVRDCKYDYYLCSKMREMPDFNYPRFNRVAAQLRSLPGGSLRVFNPAETFGGDASLPFADYMRLDIPALLESRAVIVLDDEWVTSKGARLEVSIALALGIPVWKEMGGPTTPMSRIDEVPPLGRAGPEPLTTWEEAEFGLLTEADRIVNSDRQKTYGHPYDHHSATAQMWSAYLTRTNGRPTVVRAQDVSACMILDKLSRMGGGDKVDNVLDVAGYAQVYAKVRARQEQG